MRLVSSVFLLAITQQPIKFSVKAKILMVKILYLLQGKVGAGLQEGRIARIASWCVTQIIVGVRE